MFITPILTPRWIWKKKGTIIRSVKVNSLVPIIDCYRLSIFPECILTYLGKISLRKGLGTETLLYTLLFYLLSPASFSLSCSSVFSVPHFLLGTPCGVRDELVVCFFRLYLLFQPSYFISLGGEVLGPTAHCMTGPAPFLVFVSLGPVFRC